jgi:hypothetical protein
MDHNMVTFYADGKRIGIGAGVDMLTGTKYFPVVSFSQIGHCVVVEDRAMMMTMNEAVVSSVLL